MPQKVFHATVDNYKKFELSIDKINRKLNTIGAEPYQYQKHSKFDDMGREYYEVIVIAPSFPGIDGWEPIAKFDKIPTEGVYNEYTNAAGFAVKMLGNHTPDEAIEVPTLRCDHCNTNRGRNTVYQLRNEVGENILVGGSCLDYYTGLRPSYWLLWSDATNLLSISEDIVREQLKDKIAYGLGTLLQCIGMGTNYRPPTGVQGFREKVLLKYTEVVANPQGVPEKAVLYAKQIIEFFQIQDPRNHDSEDVVNMITLSQSVSPNGGIWVPESYLDVVFDMPNKYFEQARIWYTSVAKNYRKWYAQYMEKPERDRYDICKENVDKLGFSMNNELVLVENAKQYKNSNGTKKQIIKALWRGIPLIRFGDPIIIYPNKVYKLSASITRIRIDKYNGAEIEFREYSLEPQLY